MACQFLKGYISIPWGEPKAGIIPDYGILFLKWNVFRK
jgi:hypothetical protein